MPSPKSTSTSTLVLYFLPPFPGHLMSNILSPALLQFLVFFVISTPTSIFHLAVYEKSISPTYALFWSMAASLLSVCLFALLASLKLCNRRHCPFVALILLVSLAFLNVVALSILLELRFFFSILNDDVPDHLSGFCHWPFVHTATSRTLHNSSAIRLPSPRTSLFLYSPLHLAASAYNSSITSIWAELLFIFTPSFYITNLFW